MTRLQEVCVCAYTLLVCALGRAADILSLPRCCCAATANAMLLLLLVAAAAAAVHIKPLLQTLACYCCNDRLALQVRPPHFSLSLSYADAKTPLLGWVHTENGLNVEGDSRCRILVVSFSNTHEKQQVLVDWMTTNSSSNLPVGNRCYQMTSTASGPFLCVYQRTKKLRLHCLACVSRTWDKPLPGTCRRRS